MELILIIIAVLLAVWIGWCGVQYVDNTVTYHAVGESQYANTAIAYLMLGVASLAIFVVVVTVVVSEHIKA